MARWQITLRDPLNEIPDLTLETFGRDGYDRSIVQQVDTPSFTATQSIVVAGTFAEPRYTWEIGVSLPEDEMLHLQAMIMLQDRRIAAGDEDWLILVDEMQPLPPETSPHRKTLLIPIATAYSMVYGFGVFNVILRLAEQPETIEGSLEGEVQYLVQFSAIEVP